MGHMSDKELMKVKNELFFCESADDRLVVLSIDLPPARNETETVDKLDKSNAPVEVDSYKKETRLASIFNRCWPIGSHLLSSIHSLHPVDCTGETHNVIAVIFAMDNDYTVHLLSRSQSSTETFHRRKIQLGQTAQESEIKLIRFSEPIFENGLPIYRMCHCF